MRNILIVAAIYFGLFVITMCTLQDVSAHQFNEEQCGWAAMLMREYTQDKNPWNTTRKNRNLGRTFTRYIYFLGSRRCGLDHTTS